MIKRDLERIKEVIREKGDDFWKEEGDGDGIVGNLYLIDEIVTLLNIEGLDLKLVKK